MLVSFKIKLLIIKVNIILFISQQFLDTWRLVTLPKNFNRNRKIDVNKKSSKVSFTKCNFQMVLFSLFPRFIASADKHPLYAQQCSIWFSHTCSNNKFSMVYLGGTAIVGGVRTGVRSPCAIGTCNHLVWTHRISLLFPLKDKHITNSIDGNRRMRRR